MIVPPVFFSIFWLVIWEVSHSLWCILSSFKLCLHFILFFRAKFFKDILLDEKRGVGIGIYTLEIVRAVMISMQSALSSRDHNNTELLGL